MHKEHACTYSPVLKSAFNSNFIQGQTRSHKLPGSDKEVVLLLVYWLYTQEASSKSLEEGTFGDNENDRLFKVWILCDKLLTRTLHNAIRRKIKKIQAKFDICANACIRYVNSDNRRWQSPTPVFGPPNGLLPKCS